MTKPRILIASSLKPANDSRAYYKLGRALESDWEVHMAGAPAENVAQSESTHWHYTGPPSRLHWHRLAILKRTRQCWLKVKPKVVVLCSHELLPLAKEFSQSNKVIYDLQENYRLNIQHTSAYPTFLKPWLKKIVVQNEMAALPYLSGITVAEHIYFSQMPALFEKIPSLFLPNAAVFNPAVYNPELHSPIRLLLYGTLSEHYGSKAALDWFERVQAQFPSSFELSIVGVAHEKEFRKELMRKAQGLGVSARIESKAIPYQELLPIIQQADFVLLPYAFNEATQGRIPSKAYELMGLRKPMLFSKGLDWHALPGVEEAGLSIDFAQAPDSNLLAQLKSSFYAKPLSAEIFWEHYLPQWCNFVRERLR
jgi:hypothetical protein